MDYRLERLGVVMEPDPNDPREAWGVLNPAAARGPDGELYLFPRLVAEGNYSRIGRGRVIFQNGLPVGVMRLGVALEPEEPWEQKGVEDPRITFIEEVGQYVMAYTAYSRAGPRIALAVSRDLEQWERLGLARFGDELDQCDNKDAAFFPAAVGQGLPFLHRPANEERPGIWLSCAEDLEQLVRLSGHRKIAGPEQPWEELKIGAGPPPVRTDGGWLLIYHGVSGEIDPRTDLQQNVRYCAGAMVLDAERVWEVVARTPAPLLEPETGGERSGIVPNVVFPTGIDGSHVYYGMADSRIGVARLVTR